MLEKQGPVQFGLMRTFNSPALFNMDQDSLGEIRSPDALFGYLRDISAASRKLLPRSSDYMWEEVISCVWRDHGMRVSPRGLSPGSLRAAKCVLAATAKSCSALDRTILMFA
jgi:hypothetical protein